MKKVLIPFLVAGMLCTTSCTELFEPSVDYGDQTYINDYSALVSVINDLNKSISERFEALNKLLDKNLADIKLSVDENTGAIKILGIFTKFRIFSLVYLTFLIYKFRSHGRRDSIQSLILGSSVI